MGHGGRFPAMADAIDRALSRQVQSVAQAQRLARQMGLSAPAAMIALDDARADYDALAEAYQWIQALAPHEMALRETVKGPG